MSARYHVLVSDELMASADLPWPACLRPVEQEPTDPGRYPGMHWWLFEDDDAHPVLEGKQVELTFRQLRGEDDVTTVIVHRSVMP